MDKPQWKFNYEIPILVCSIGGVGSSYFVSKIYPNSKVRLDAQERKHTIHPYYVLRENRKVFRRGYQRSHEINMSYGKYWFESQDEFSPRLTQSVSLYDYLDEGIDRFNFTEHLNNWMNFDDGKTEIMIVKYEDLPKTIDKVSQFLGVNGFELKNRQSNWKELPTVWQTKMKSMCEESAQIISEMPSLIEINLD
jgi:hypothetical protein